jgi:hypothetical protein
MYDQEICSVRRKEFWPLYHTGKVLNKFMEGLSHPADGVILQGQCSCSAAGWLLMLHGTRCPRCTF